MTDRDKVDELLSELDEIATEIELELAKEEDQDQDDTELMLVEESVENLANYVSSQAYQLRTTRRVLQEGSKPAEGDSQSE